MSSFNSHHVPSITLYLGMYSSSPIDPKFNSKTMLSLRPPNVDITYKTKSISKRCILLSVQCHPFFVHKDKLQLACKYTNAYIWKRT